MVMSCYLQTILDETSEHSVMTLPTYKDPGLKLEFCNSKDIETVYKDKAPPLPFARSEIYHAEILSWSRITAVNEDCKAVYEITFDVKGSKFEFKAGDTVGILPRNRTQEVNLILEHLGITTEADLGYNLSLGDQKGTKIPHIPVKSTLRHVLTYCVELRSVLKKLFILALSKHTKCDTERKSLEYLCSKEGSAAYTEHILNKNKCILDIFTNFKTCKPPIEILLAHLPRLLPRPYSVVNSSLKDSSVLKICFSVMDIGNNRQGITTGWLESLILDMKSLEGKIISKESLESRFSEIKLSSIQDRIECIPMYHRKNMSDFSLPPNISTHLIMIATGTGVAPFMGFLEEREMQKAQSNKGEAWLFFGCRNPELDFIYEGRMEEYRESKVLNKLITAFSRVKSVEARRVQNSLCDNGKDLARLIEEGASIFVCGEAKTMVTQVKESVISLLVQHGGKSMAEAKEIVDQMEKDKRYVVDLWS